MFNSEKKNGYSRLSCVWTTKYDHNLRMFKHVFAQFLFFLHLAANPVLLVEVWN